MSRNQVIISFSDLWRSVRKNVLIILFGSFILGVVFFGYLLSKPICYTAQGTFKGGSPPPSSSLSKALKLLDEESYSSHDDPNFFLSSYPVMSGVVRKLNLQAALSGRRKKSRLKQLWYTFKAEQWKKKHIHSSISSKKITPSLSFVDETIPLACENLYYPGEQIQILSVRLDGKEGFKVRQGKKVIGKGEYGVPFLWEEGEFTLVKKNKSKKKQFTLTLIPFEMAVESLQHTIRVTKPKKNPALTHVSYTHRDRHLAAAIVNTTMSEFENYLQEDGRKKIVKQLSYLEERRNMILDQLEETMQSHQLYLEDHLDSGAFLSLEKEVDYLSSNQAELRTKLSKLNREIGSLERKNLPAAEIHQGTTIEGTRSLLREHERDLDRILFQQKEYDESLKKLSENDFDSSSLSKVLDDPIHFETVHRLHRQLTDEKNWTAKEREYFTQELELEKEILAKHIQHLKEGAKVKEEALQKNILSLKATLLALLQKQRAGIEKGLNEVIKTIGHYPEKWLSSQKIEFNKKISEEMMESITKMIEAKNMNFHLDYLNATPIKLALPPSLPNPPNLRLGFFAGFFGSLFLALIGLCLWEVWRTPRATVANLQAAGCRIWSPKEPVIGNRVAILSKRDEKELVEFYKENGKEVRVSETLLEEADTTLYCVDDERFSDLPTLPENTLFVVPSAGEKASLTQIRPFVDKLFKQFSSFSQKT